MKCSVCENESSIGVACVPGVAMSVPYGERCLRANAHPWPLLVANTVCLGGLGESADWWRQMVEDTCRHLGRTVEEFEADVLKAAEK